MLLPGIIIIIKTANDKNDTVAKCHSGTVKIMSLFCHCTNGFHES